MNSSSYQSTRAQIFQRLKALFEFDSNGVLPCMAPGMSGPIALPWGHLDVTNLRLNGKLLGDVLFLSWTQEEKAQILTKRPQRKSAEPEAREATNEELQCALEHYEKAVCEYRQTVLDRCVAPGDEAPLWLKKRLGLAPYFDSSITTIPDDAVHSGSSLTK